MKVVLSIDISPKLLGVINEEEFKKKLEQRCLTLVKSFEKKWDVQNSDLNQVSYKDEIEVNWDEIIKEGFSDAKKSIEARVWG